MKHFITLLAAVLCVVRLSGCEEQKTQEQIGTYVASNIIEFNYKGHKYLLYRQSYNKGGVGGIAHDPDCPCHKKRDEN